ncbi:hypothetical protein SAG0323_05825 [Streptococcus agalactiae GB00279]|nr:hypothetical protein SAG0323_05825 [Streptococcus agalactiae GB00279]
MKLKIEGNDLEYKKAKNALQILSGKHILLLLIPTVEKLS